MYFLAVALIACQGSSSTPVETEVPASSKDSCNDPDAPIPCYFLQMPAATGPVLQISKPGEKGEALIISGRMLLADGRTPAAGIKLYAYHTDATGIYSRGEKLDGVLKHHGALHGWLTTDAAGRYEIRTIRPASYPQSRIPQHIHAALLHPDGKTEHITDFVFADDPFIDQAYINNSNRWNFAGGTGVVTLRKEGNMWKGERDIVLK
jgi:protocatechuate 3,4-dioxygenase beta subunit